MRSRKWLGTLIPSVGWLLVSAWLAVGSCPPGTLASDSQMVSGKFGTMAVEVCVTRDGSMDTYTYTMTLARSGPDSPSGFALGGYGRFDTLDTSSSSGLRSTVSESDCATWWMWSSLRVVPAPPPAVALHRRATFTLTLAGPTEPVPVPASIASAAGAVAEFTILGPSACAESRSDGAAISCTCTDAIPPVCTGISAFVGDGTRIRVMGGPEMLTISECEPTWVQHGFLTTGDEEMDVAFRLFVDGVPIGLTEQSLCGPSTEAGSVLLRRLWSKQFSPFAFAPGVHEVRGEWEWFDTPEEPGFVFDRTVLVEVVPCLPEPIPVEPLANLVPEVVRSGCDCDWTVQQVYECRLTSTVVVTNKGDAPSEGTSVLLLAAGTEDTASIPPLDPGETRRAILRTVFAGIKPGDEPCPLSVVVEVDPRDVVPESNENDNQAESEACCE